MATAVVSALTSAARTTSGSVALGALPAEYTELCVYINVTAISGTTPQMIVTYQSGPDAAIFYDNVAGSPIVQVGKQLLKVPSCVGRFGNIAYAISGTSPSFTFTVTVEAKRP